MRELKGRLRSVLVLAVALGLTTWALSPSEAQAGRHIQPKPKNCSYGSGTYSMGACRGGQRCVRGRNDEDYWSDDTNCPQTSPGPGGRIVM